MSCPACAVRCGIAFSLVSCLGLQAATLTWQPTTGGAFGTASNWSPAQKPTASDILEISTSSGQTHTLTNDLSGLSVGRVRFTNGGSSNEGTVTLTGNPLTIAWPGTASDAALFVYYPRAHIQVPVTFTADAPFLITWSRGQLYFEDTVTCLGKLIGVATPYSESLTSAGAPVHFQKTFSAAQGFEIRTGHYICDAANVLDSGLVVTFACQDATKNASSLNLEGFDQTIDRLTFTPGGQTSAKHALVRNTTTSACTLTMNATADGGTDALFSGPLSLAWNPVGAYTFTAQGGRASTMTGSISVGNGTFAVADGTTFRSVRAVTLAANARCVWTNWPFATDAFTLAPAAGASFWADAADVRFPAATFAVTGTLALPANAVVKMASTDTVTVSEGFTFNGLTLALTDAAAPTAGTHNLFVVNQELDDAVRTAWTQTALASSSVTDPSCAYSFRATVADGKTSFALVVTSLSAPPNTVTYDGTQTDLWAADTCATFAGADPKAVSVSGDVAAGALAFTAGGYTLSGSGTLAFSPDYQAQVAADAVTAAITGPAFTVPAERWLKVDVAQGGVLTFGQSLAGGGLWKTGGGRLALTNPANAFDLPAQIDAGMLTADPADALGTDAALLTGGTLALGGTDKTAAPPPLALTVKTGAAKTLAIVKCETAALVTNFTSVSGAFLKRGGGTLTIRAGADETVALASGNGNGNAPTWSDKWSFDADGLPTPEKSDAGFLGLNVFEGALALAGAGTSSVFRLAGGVHAGGGLTQTYAAQPVLAVSNCVADLSGSTLYLGSGIQGSNAKPASTTLAVRDGTLRMSALYEGYDAGRAASTYYRCQTALTNATLEVTGTFHANNSNSGSSAAPHYKTSATATNAQFLAQSVEVGGRGSNKTWGYTPDARTFEASLFGCRADRSRGQAVTFLYGADVDWTFRLGSVWHIASLRANSGMRAVFTFDDATWLVDPDTFDIRFGGPDGNTRIVLAGAGLALGAAAGQVRNIHTPVTGTGAFVKTGAGTVNFKAGEYLLWTDATLALPTPSGTTLANPNGFTSCTTNACADATTARYTGPTRVLGGTLAFASGTLAADAVTNVEIAAGATLDFGGATRTGLTLAGAGTLANAVLAGTTTLAVPLAADWTGAAAPTLAATCSFADGARVVVDFGHTAAAPLAETLPGAPVTVARYAGAAPDVRAWKLAGTGLAGVCGTFRAADGAVSVHPVRPGMMIYVR